MSTSELEKSGKQKSKLTQLDPFISCSWAAANEVSHHSLTGI